MLADHAKVLKIFTVTNEIIGRKKLQKMIYIAKKMNFPFQQKYSFHFFGPYSEEVTLQVEELCNLGFLEEMYEKKGGYYQYRYALTKSGSEFLAHFDIDTPHFSETFQMMNEQSSRFLELVSTVMYFDTFTKEEVKEKISVVKNKQKYTDEEIAEAYDYIDVLNGQLSLFNQ